MGKASPIPSGNRYSILSDSIPKPPKAKRKKPIITEDSFPVLPEPVKTINANDPKFILIKSTDTSNPIAKYSVFAKKKALDSISTEYSSVDILRDGSLLVLTKSNKVAEKFLKCKNFGGLCPVSIELHASLNTCKGTIFDLNLANTEEQEILEGLKSQGVVAVYKFTKICNGEKVPTGRIVLTFNLYKVPHDIDIAWYSVRVEEYFPTPMRCRNCQLLGHTIKRCNNNPTCENCNMPPHNPELCQRTMCANCLGSHSASDKYCPLYLQQKEILKIKTQNKCNYKEAKRLYKIHNPTPVNSKQSYASVANSTQPQSSTLNSNSISLSNCSNSSNDPSIPSQTNNNSYSNGPNKSFDLIKNTNNNYNTTDLQALFSSFITSHNSLPLTTHDSNVNSNLSSFSTQQNIVTTHTVTPHSLSIRNSINSTPNSSLLNNEHNIATTCSSNNATSLSSNLNPTEKQSLTTISYEHLECVDSHLSNKVTKETYTDILNSDHEEPVL
ncbi:protein PF3D7_1417600-like [Anastrepha obliqua]|uniref:protein PF3D7_1417600-like n=1 Tax=Anastrepha obliqua TaxID=95512 RepID=UPI00240A3EFC|nr:protein PF3D7_1417600-like [Anastrepha obliqua]